MTDVSLHPASAAARRLDMNSDEAKARIRRRYRSEARFRSYGLIAIVITAIFLVVLITDILIKGIPAFTQHSITLDVPVTAEKADPSGDRSEMSLRLGDYNGMVRDAVKEALGVDGRVASRNVGAILSSGSGDSLRAAVAADPSVIGTTMKTQALLADEADLYFKGVGTDIDRAEGQGQVTPSAVEKDVTLTGTPGSFEAIATVARDVIAERLRVLNARIALYENSPEQSLRDRAPGMKENAAVLEALVNGQTAEIPFDSRMPSQLISVNGGLVKVNQVAGDTVTGEALIPLKSIDTGNWQRVTYDTPESDRQIGDTQVAYLDQMNEKGLVSSGFNTRFFTAGDSREPELAGIRGALVGSILTLAVTLALCLPIGVMAAVYLEEFASKNWFTDIIEININNLAAVPSIVFGLLGLAVFLNFFGFPRSAPFVGGLVLALLVLPTIIIASRAALRAVPPSIKEAALGVGASHQQAIFHHVLPLAMPGIMTGTIIGMAHALGETAPLLMIGMVAFIVDVPSGFTDSATVLPVQIFLWSDLPEAAFKQKTAAAIIVLLMVLFGMNGFAIWLRKRFERRW